jgi:hypothetical protein
MRKYNLAHAQRVENWFGKELLNQIVEGSKDFYCHVPVANVPGEIFAYKGEIYGTIQGGSFSSLSDLIQQATTEGKRQDVVFHKAGSLAVNASFSSLWNVGNNPSAGGAPTTIPSGTFPTNATNGSFKQSNATGTDTLHLTTAYAQGSAAPNTLLLYDRLWHGGSVLHTVNTAQTINGSPSRYLGTESKGNFAFLEVTTLLGATAHNLTMTYVDQDGNSAEAATALAVIVSSAATRIPHTPWFVPLSAGDTGIRRITQVQFSASSTAGVSNAVIGHPIAFIPCPIANSAMIVDGINSAFSLVQIKNDACPALLEIKGVATATNYTGQVILVST